MQLDLPHLGVKKSPLISDFHALAKRSTLIDCNNTTALLTNNRPPRRLQAASTFVLPFQVFSDSAIPFHLARVPFCVTFGFRKTLVGTDQSPEALLGASGHWR